MPYLQALGRTWSVGSDDFVFSALRGFLLNAAVTVYVPIVFRFDSEGCGTSVHRYIIAVFVTHALMMLAMLTLSLTSARGGIFEPSRRRHVPSLIGLVLALGVVIIGVLVWGMLLYFRHNACGNPGEPKGDRDFILTTWILQLVVVVVMLMKLVVNFDWSGGVYHLDPEGQERYDSLWTSRCRAMMCCVTVEDTEIVEAARIVAGTFANLDLTMTDVEAGLTLLAARQSHLCTQAQLAAGLRLKDNTARGFSDVRLSHEAQPVARFPRRAEADLETLRRYSKYFMGAYGWPMHVLEYPCAWTCRQCSARCKGFPKNWRGKITGDFGCCCGCHTSAFFAQTGIEPDQLLHMSWTSEFSQPAFYLAVDHDMRSIIIGVRGTMNLEDVLTDGCAIPVPFGEHLCEGGTAHSGMVKAARQICRALHKDGLLEDTMARHQGYGLVALGHSLGAGTAALLAVELSARYQDVLGLAYSPPGGLMSWNLTVAADFIIAVGLGLDVVPRASIRNVHEFRDRMMASFAKTDARKCEILCFCCCRSQDAKARDWFKLGHDHDAREAELDETKRSLMSYMSSLYAASESARLDPMFPPARYIHIMRFGRRDGGCGPCMPGEAVLHPVSVDVRQLMAEGMRSSVHMVLDHMPHYVRDAIVQVADKAQRLPLEGWGADSGWVNPLPQHHESWDRALMAAPRALMYQPPDVHEAHKTPRDVSLAADADQTAVAVPPALAFSPEASPVAPARAADDIVDVDTDVGV